MDYHQESTQFMGFGFILISVHIADNGQIQF